MSTIVLSKFDVAERQLLQSIVMFFRKEDPVSIHTLAEASAQVLYDIGTDFDVESLIRDSDRIREGKKREWLSYVFKSKNFFKHADRDKDENHEFKTEFNHFSLFDAVNMYMKIKKKWVPETLVFIAWFAVKYPNLIKEDSDLSLYVNGLQKKGAMPEHNDKSQLLRFIELMRDSNIMPDKVTLKYGL